MTKYVIEAELNNGGFSQWMFNGDGDHAELAVAALREIGADGAASVCERFFALLPVVDRSPSERCVRRSSTPRSRPSARKHSMTRVALSSRSSMRSKPT